MKIEIWSRETRKKEAGYAAQLIEALPLNFTRTRIALELLVRRIDIIDGRIGTIVGSRVDRRGVDRTVGGTVDRDVGSLDGAADGLTVVTIVELTVGR